MKTATYLNRTQTFATAFRMVFFAILSLVLTSGTTSSVVSAQQLTLKYQPAPIDNPLKGLVPYWGQQGPFPCSMEFWYFPIKDIMTGANEFDWATVEKKIADIQGHGNQAIIRTYLEYPGEKSALPDFLLEQGVKIKKYKHDGDTSFTPDYHNPVLIEAMENFVAAFGKQYDGDPRVAFITMGVLGHWGEWHTYPKEKLFASKADQTKIQDAFATAFKKTKVLMRYPAGEDDWMYAPNAQQPFGYHDDSFAWATLDTGKEDEDWFFETRLKTAGKAALEKWKTQPIGGEIRPEVWGCVFDKKSGAPKGQEFDPCVQRTHVSWLMDSGMFREAKPHPTEERIQRATQSVQKMGYELHVSAVNLVNKTNLAIVELKVENRGVAPFYYDWPVELLVIGSDTEVIAVQEMDWQLSTVLPGEPVTWSGTIKLGGGRIDRLAIRVRNPMTEGKPLRFANTTQREDGLMLLE